MHISTHNNEFAGVDSSSNVTVLTPSPQHKIFHKEVGRLPQSTISEIKTPQIANIYILPILHAYYKVLCKTRRKLAIKVLST